MPRKTYVAVDGSAYEGIEIVGVYGTQAKALKALDGVKAGYSDYLEVRVYALNGERLYNDPEEYLRDVSR